MRGLRRLLVPALALLAPACIGNEAPGNDREAELDPPPRPAGLTTPGAALAGVAVGLVSPQIMTEADRGNLPAMTSPCFFRMTRVGEPAVVYGSQAVVKLNDRLVTLPADGSGRWAADGVSVTVEPLDEGAEREGLFEAEFVLRLPGSSDELGFHGFSECR